MSLTAAIGFEIDHQFRRLESVGQKAVRLLVGPIGEIHHHASLAVVLVSLDGFHDVEAFAVEKITTCRCLHLADNVSDLPLSGAVVSRHVASLA